MNIKLTLHDKNRGIKLAWFFMIITIGSFLNEIKNALEDSSNKNFEHGFEAGYKAGGTLGTITLLAIGMILYTRTKRRKLGYVVKGSKFIDYILAFILGINFIFPLLSGKYVNGTSNDVMSFFYVTGSLLAFAYALLAKPKKRETPNKNEQK